MSESIQYEDLVAETEARVRRFFPELSFAFDGKTPDQIGAAAAVVHSLLCERYGADVLDPWRLAPERFEQAHRLTSGGGPEAWAGCAVAVAEMTYALTAAELLEERKTRRTATS